ncbi:Cof-type HAD-IIB family hydrolase [Psychrobacillus vulpis]|uniref:Cof-type HAD-IIB family hydrolase n=1 Tax=Psychrobacillus vulpis TaxID=2325572 RepID=A0A544TRT0_9BACI|nr:Cof-type HAD-IIB family hydrolase [Psychrobacillus vulpis]TQR20149.1 Cof-type HAD-IIB family hydrolase [Psychrobacillus vulpis]
MENKILFFDIDGTILDNDKNIPVGVKEAIDEAKENGHEVVISTGRSPFTAKFVLEQLNIDSFICYNGQIVQYKGNVIHKGILDKKELQRLTDFATVRDQPLVYMDSYEMVSNLPEHQDVFESISSLKISYPRKAENFFLTNDIHQALIFCDAEVQKEYEHVFPNLKFVRWHRVSCDVLPKGVSKAKGIEILLNHLSKSPEDAIAFGDGLNDLEMLQFVGTGVAMGNSVEGLKQYATFVTDHVSENGLINALKKLNLIR